MLRKMFKTRVKPSKAPGSIPAGERVYAIGDIHGCLDLLDQLLGKIDIDDHARGPARTTLIFLGDVIDRGPESAAVIDRLIALKADRPTTRFILGNHEEIFLGSIDGDEKAVRLFCRIGGRETVLSYGVTPEAYERSDHDELCATLRSVVPADHRSFLAGFEDLIEIGDYAFVHAGVRPDRPLADQRKADLRWIRDVFLDHPHSLEKIIVHGHTIADDIEISARRIGVDTGAYATGRLSAVGLQGNDSWRLQTG
ncbi:metallophosphoesterase family protein [Sphingomonas bacterium]|uniref:metallophosphoesterase family protein n=1 Tax=Sphingomonas bacterium TaxID=1895847 RepID=UPI00157598CC|nr:metallophosphoesterase family protein [Sphingomonas bacterium]